MQIGEDADPETSQRLGQPGDRKDRARQLEMMAFVQKTVGPAPGRYAESDPDEPLEQLPTVDRGHGQF